VIQKSNIYGYRTLDAVWIQQKSYIDRRNTETEDPTTLISDFPEAEISYDHHHHRLYSKLLTYTVHTLYVPRNVRKRRQYLNCLRNRFKLFDVCMGICSLLRCHISIEDDCSDSGAKANHIWMLFSLQWEVALLDVTLGNRRIWLVNFYLSV